MSEPSAERITLWQVDGCWGLPSASPFCVKLEAWLRMTGVPFRAAPLRGRPRSASGKVPYVELADGRVLDDTHVIIEALRAERGITLDRGLDGRQRALTTALTRALEEHLYWAIVWDRWLVDEHWPVTREAYFRWVPRPLRWILPGVARRDVRRMARGQGIGRMSDTQIMARVQQDLAALSEWVTGDAEIFGQPSGLDATVFAFVLGALRPPFDGPLQRAVRQRPGLVRFCERFERRWW